MGAWSNQDEHAGGLVGLVVGICFLLVGAFIAFVRGQGKQVPKWRRTPGLIVIVLGLAALITGVVFMAQPTTVDHPLPMNVPMAATNVMLRSSWVRLADVPDELPSDAKLVTKHGPVTESKEQEENIDPICQWTLPTVSQVLALDTVKDQIVLIANPMLKRMPWFIEYLAPAEINEPDNAKLRLELHNRYDLYTADKSVHLTSTHGSEPPIPVASWQVSVASPTVLTGEALEKGT